MRELPRDAGVQAAFLQALRSFDDAVGYAPHQAYLGSIHPRDLPARPWIGAPLPGAQRFVPGGEVMPEDEFLALMACMDQFGLVVLDPAFAEAAAAKLAQHPLAKALDLDRVTAAAGDAEDRKS